MFFVGPRVYVHSSAHKCLWIKKDIKYYGQNQIIVYNAEFNRFKK